MKNIIVFLIICFGGGSCSFSQKNIHNQNIMNSIEEMKNRSNYNIPDSLFSFFPKSESLGQGVIQENAEKIDIPVELSEFNPAFIVEIYKINDVDAFRKKILEHEKSALYTLNVEQSDYFIIGSARALYEEYDSLSLQKHFQEFQHKPLLYNFGENLREMKIPLLYDSTTTCGLAKGFQILLLKMGNQCVLPPKYSYEWSLLPNKIRHGYCSGIAFRKNDLYIIYWTVAW